MKTDHPEPLATGTCSAIVGIAAAPGAAELIRTMFKSEPPLPWGEIPVIIDPRMSIDFTEVYRDRQEWRERVSEQNAWDSQNASDQATAK